MSAEAQGEFEVLESRLRTILPEQYQDREDEVGPVSMGSAGLKYGGDGRVAWDEMWASFCDLAMAGGPPHKGTLLEPGSAAEIDAQRGRTRQVVDEICRGIRLVAGLEAEESATPGWVRVECGSAGMAGWLLRAIVMENVSARCEGAVLEVPTGPGYRVEKEIKNVITVIAKTCHYWVGHVEAARKLVIAELFAGMERESPLLRPELQDVTLRGRMAEGVARATGLRASDHNYAGWLGVECGDVHAAIWMMRALVASNVLSRREETVVFVPVDAVRDADGARVVADVTRVHGFAVAAKVFGAS